MGKKVTLEELKKQIRNTKPASYTWEETTDAHNAMVAAQQKVLKDFGISKKKKK